jgi:hypothetical protein
MTILWRYQPRLPVPCGSHGPGLRPNGKPDLTWPHAASRAHTHTPGGGPARPTRGLATSSVPAADSELEHSDSEFKLATPSPNRSPRPAGCEHGAGRPSVVRGLGVRRVRAESDASGIMRSSVRTGSARRRSTNPVRFTPTSPRPP